MTKADTNILVEFLLDEFANDASAVAEWLQDHDIEDIDEFIQMCKEELGLNR